MELMGHTFALWQWLIIGAVALILAEAVVPGFVLMPIGVGLFLTAGVAAITKDPVILWTSLIVLEGTSIFVIRKYFKHLLDKPRILTNAEGMVGKEAIVIEAIAAGGSGYVKLYGDTWMARSFSTRTINQGEHVHITKIDGNKVWVEPMHE